MLLRTELTLLLRARMAMLALILGLEHTLANRFYGRHNKKQTA